MTGFLCPIASTQSQHKTIKLRHQQAHIPKLFLYAIPFSSQNYRINPNTKDETKLTCTNIKYTCWRDGQTDRQINRQKHRLTEDAARQLVTSCVLSRVDYCNSLLMGTPNSVIQPMQKVQNRAARLILRAPRHQNCTPLLQQLHWLPISERIKYKTACMCYNAITGSSPSYQFLSCYTFTVLPALSALRQTHACSKSNASTAKPMAFALSHTLAPTSGTISPKT